MSVCENADQAAACLPDHKGSLGLRRLWWIWAGNLLLGTGSNKGFLGFFKTITSLASECRRTLMAVMHPKA